MLRADQHQTASGRQQHQQVQLFAVARVTLAGLAAQVGVGQRHTGQGRGQHQGHVVAGEFIHQQQRRDLDGRYAQGRQQRQQGQVKAQHREAEGQRVVALPGDSQHHQHHRGTGDQQRQQRDKVLSREFHTLLTGPEQVD